MKKEEDIKKLAASLKRELKVRRVVWPVLILLLGLVVWRDIHRAMSHVQELGNWPVAQSASPETVRLETIQSMIPLTVDLSLITFALILCAYCILEVCRPQTQTKLLLKLTESLGEKHGANQASHAISEPAPGADTSSREG